MTGFAPAFNISWRCSSCFTVAGQQPLFQLPGRMDSVAPVFAFNVGLLRSWLVCFSGWYSWFRVSKADVLHSRQHLSSICCVLAPLWLNNALVCGCASHGRCRSHLCCVVLVPPFALACTVTWSSLVVATAICLHACVSVCTLRPLLVVVHGAVVSWSRRVCVLGGLHTVHPALCVADTSRPVVPCGQGRMLPLLVWRMLASCCPL